MEAELQNMHLEKLILLNFKNLANVNIELCSKINGFVGNNGAGKTNVLDAIYYLSFGKSYFLAQDQPLIKSDEPFLVVEGHYQRKDRQEHVVIGVKPEHKKQIKRNKKTYDRLLDHIGLFPLVLISPTDTDLILEGSETRRKFMDGVIAQSNKSYLQNLVDYNKVLSQRNALLKYFAKNRTFDPETLSIYDQQLDALGHQIHQARNAFVEELEPMFMDLYQSLSGGNDAVGLQYDSVCHHQRIAEALVDKLDRDRILQYTSVGIHKDDLKFTLDGLPIKKRGSQGQQKSFLIALKLAQYKSIAQHTNMKPLLLLDDVFDKLDDLRVEALIRMVNEEQFGQIFITDTHPQRMAEILNKIQAEQSLFLVETGTVVKHEEI